MSLTDGKNILVYVETAQGAPVGPALEILAKAKELAAAKGEEVIAAILAEAPEEAGTGGSGITAFLIYVIRVRAHSEQNYYI